MNRDEVLRAARSLAADRKEDVASAIVRFLAAKEGSDSAAIWQAHVEVFTRRYEAAEAQVKRIEAGEQTHYSNQVN